MNCVDLVFNHTSKNVLVNLKKKRLYLEFCALCLPLEGIEDDNIYREREKERKRD